MNRRPSTGDPKWVSWSTILVTFVLVIGCNNNSFSGSSRSSGPSAGDNNRPGSENSDKNRNQPGNGGTPSSGDKLDRSDKVKPADKLDSSSEEACKNTLTSTGFKDPLNGRVYRMLEGKYNYCQGHKQCDDYGKNARFPLVGEKASDDIMRCGAVTKSWLDVSEDQRDEMCDGERIKSRARLHLADSGSGKNLSLYTFEADKYVSADEPFQIICVYNE